MFIKDDHLTLITADDADIKWILRGKIFRSSTVLCIGSAFAFHLLLSAFGEAAFMWVFISMPLTFVFNVFVLLVIMEIMNRRKAL